jgi:quinol-cytochrome oxidoreductase complex cytochrome b subunit
MSIHLLRVTLTGAYAPPRRFNHVLGVALLAFILLLDFTGYVLRWDEGIHWALVVGANMLKTVPWIGEGLYKFVIGGSEPGDSTLIRFYAWHIFGLTIGMVILITWHAFRVRRDGGIAIPPPAERKEHERITRFNLVRREVLAMTITAVILILFSLIFPAPIKQPMSTVSTMGGDSTAPWFFLWIQYLLKFGDPFVMGILVPVLVVVALGSLPYILPNAKSNELGKWFPRGNRIAQVIAVLIMFTILLLTVLGAIPNSP